MNDTQAGRIIVQLKKLNDSMEELSRTILIGSFLLGLAILIGIIS